MRTITASDVHATMQTPDGSAAFGLAVVAMLQLHKAWCRTTEDEADVGRPGFNTHELEELRREQAGQAQFEAAATMADFINKVITASGGRADGGP